ncbi:cytochrome b/b6 domain-containing protein [Celeribacter baekdonensis]|uniref:cytochrome b/b6 domain-containing protein n=1 Tax=Celeribacter baekdonensis TaxID=875171 RepID=UPI003A8F8B13
MLANTDTRYGLIARLFHWVIALLILTDLALGLIGENIPRTAETVETLKTLYSVHKTIGVSVLFLAILRILWALTQTRPVPVHPERRAEMLLAEIIHWALYGAIIVMPLSGWVIHSAESGFAPILWPFGQNLPFVVKSEALAHTAGAVHGLSALVIYLSVGLHIAGALKHAVIERDGVLGRMIKGRDAGTSGQKATTPHAVPPLAALVLWAGVIGFAVFGPTPPMPEAEAAQMPTTAPVATAAGPASDLPVWTVQDGSLGITVTQMGAGVEGSFANWSAAIAYDPDTGTGDVSVAIDTTSLTLGSVTTQAQGPEFFDTATYASATFAGPISRMGDGPDHKVVGTLSLVGQTAPVTLEFTLNLVDDTATMSGQAVLDRRDFGMGAAYADESTVGYSVTVDVSLTATRAP